MASSNSFPTILGFTNDDLAANREGQLSAAQIVNRKKIARSSAMGCFWIIGCVFALSLFFLFTFNNLFSGGGAKANLLTDPSFTIPGILCLLSGILTLIALRSAYLPRTPALGHLTGSVVRGNVTPDKKVYEVEINGRGFKVPQAAYDLIDPAKVYTVYSADIRYDMLTVHSRDDNNYIVAMEESSTEAVDGKAPIEYAQEKFRRIFGFTDGELEANRAGKLSERQTAWLSSGIGNGVTRGLFLGIVFALLPFIFIGLWTQNALWIAGGAGFFLLFLFLTTRGARSGYQKLAKAIRAGTATADGTAKAWVTKVKHRSSRRSWTETVYHIQVGEVKFKVSDDVYYAFKDGSAYHVYYVKSLSNKIVSVEQIG